MSWFLYLSVVDLLLSCSVLITPSVLLPWPSARQQHLELLLSLQLLRLYDGSCCAAPVRHWEQGLIEGLIDTRHLARAEVTGSVSIIGGAVVQGLQSFPVGF